MKFKIRCSQISQITANPPKTKTAYYVGGKEISTAKYNKIVDSVLSTGDISLIQHVEIKKLELESSISAGAKTYCKNWLKDKLFSRETSFFGSKYTEKGNQVEEDGINLIVEVLKLGMVYNNTERKEDEYKAGEIDFIHEDTIIDNKSSFSLSTFPLFEDSLDKQYYEQMQGYLDLWDKPKGIVCYTLIDTPIELLAREIKWLETDDEKQSASLNHLFTKEAFEKAKESLFPNAKSINFEPIPKKHRVKAFEVYRDINFINDLHNKVIGCRQYINDLKNNL